MEGPTIKWFREGWLDHDCDSLDLYPSREAFDKGVDRHHVGIRTLLDDFVGRKVRITIEVLEEGDSQ